MLLNPEGTLLLISVSLKQQVVLRTLHFCPYSDVIVPMLHYTELSECTKKLNEGSNKQ